MERFLELLGKDPWSMTVLIICLISLAFYCGATWDSIANLKKNMLTRDQLEVSLSDFRENLRETFIVRGECEMRHGQRVISVEEHADLMARVKALEKQIGG